MMRKTVADCARGNSAEETALLAALLAANNEGASTTGCGPSSCAATSG